MILADTNVVSEFMRNSPDRAVVDWASTVEPQGLAISVITVQEIEHGLRQLPEGRRRQDLEKAWARVSDAFAASITSYDRPMAEATAEALVAAQAAGRPMALADAQIAGTCLARGWTLATRNVTDFEALLDLTIVNPFNP